KTEAGKENWVDLHKDRLTKKTLQAKYWPDKKGKQKIESSKKRFKKPQFYGNRLTESQRIYKEELIAVESTSSGIFES
ncbi:unnamed protein product, partial [Pocillopora meandrina]